MGNPTFLDSTIHPFRYYTENISPSLSTQITATLAVELQALGWSYNAGTYTFTSPTNSAGKFIYMVADHPALTRWRMALYDGPTMKLICYRTLYLNNSGATNAYYYTGRDYFYIETIFSSTGYFAYAYMIDTFPDDSSAVPFPVFGNAITDSSGAGDGVGYLDYCFAIDNQGPAYQNHSGLITAIGGSNYSPRMASGRSLFLPFRTTQLLGAGYGARVWTGRFPQTLIGPSALTPGNEYVVPVTTSTTGTFRALFQTTTTGTPIRIFLRKA